MKYRLILGIGLSLLALNFGGCDWGTGGNSEIPDGAVHLSMRAVHDPQINGMQAFGILVPDGWTVEGGIEWDHRLNTLIQVGMRFESPTGVALELFPVVPFTWAQGGIAFFPQGSIYLGSFVQPPPSDIPSFMNGLFLPTHRSGSQAQILSRTQMPDVARTLLQSIQEQGLQKSVLAERVRVQYGDGSLEDFLVALSFAQSPQVPGTTLWRTERIYSFRGSAQAIEANEALMQTMVNSIEMELSWFHQYMQVLEMWMQNQQQAIQNAGEISRYISQVNAEISDIHRQVYENQQKTYDKIHDDFVKYIRGTEDWSSPGGANVNLPSGFSQAWQSSSGGIVLSNSAGFNPNGSLNGSWTQLQRAP